MTLVNPSSLSAIKSIQRGVLSAIGSTITISPVDINKSNINYLGMVAASNQPNDIYGQGLVLTNSTTITRLQSTAQPTAWEVIEYN